MLIYKDLMSLFRDLHTLTFLNSNIVDKEKINNIHHNIFNLIHSFLFHLIIINLNRIKYNLKNLFSIMNNYIFNL